MRTYKHWDLMDSLPAGWTIDNHAGSPLAGYLFATNGSPLRGGKRALVRVVPAQRQLFDAGVVCSKMETTTPGPDEKSKPTQVVDAHYARTVNDLARAKFMRKLLADILVDLTICEIEGWCKHDYLNALVELINGIGRQPDLPPNVKVKRRPWGASQAAGGSGGASTLRGLGAWGTATQDSRRRRRLSVAQKPMRWGFRAVCAPSRVAGVPDSAASLDRRKDKTP